MPPLGSVRAESAARCCGRATSATWLVGLWRPDLGSKLAPRRSELGRGTHIGSLGDALKLDTHAAVETITSRLRTQVGENLRRRGVVVALSGGVDSSVCAALAVRALGAERVLGLVMPERESVPADTDLAVGWARSLGISHQVEDISAILDSCGAYRRRDAAIRSLVPEYDEGWRCKISLPAGRPGGNQLSVFFLTVAGPGGQRGRVRLTPEAYREVVAATSFKQRTRAMLAYYHADRLHYAVLGTPNRLEYDQGFFVKGGDGLADLKPIAHLYKTQVYQLARMLGVPPAICERVPSTGTYPLEQGQDEFYFGLPLPLLDRALFAHDRGLGPEVLAEDLGIAVGDAVRIFRDIERKRVATGHLHRAALLVEPMEAVG